MIYELPRSAHGKVRPLFDNLGRGKIYVDAVFEGNHPGRLFVDDRKLPCVALMATKCGQFYIAGQPDHRVFNMAMREQILTELIPADGHVLLFPISAMWEHTLENLFAGFRLLRVTRRAFILDRERFRATHEGWRSRIPDGYKLQRYDRRLSEAAGVLESWGSVDAFLLRGAGFALMRNGEVVSRCHTELVGDDEAEINVETAPEYRHHGYAALVMCASDDYCMMHGLMPTWSCWENNAAAQIRAQKLGFAHSVDIPAIYAKVK